MAVLSFHLLPGAGPDAVTRTSQSAPAVKLCDAGEIATARAAGAAFVYWRPYLAGDNGDCADGAGWAGQVWPTLQAHGAVMPDAIGYRNEITSDPGQVRQYLAYRAELRRQGYGGLVVFGSYPTGTPDWGQWPAITAAFGADRPDAIELHEYWDLTVARSSPWWALRHVEAIRRGLLPAAWRIFIGECGSDALTVLNQSGQQVPAEDAEGRRGWQDRDKLTAEQQIANLGAFIAGCAPSVRACFVFADGTEDPNWLSYATFGTPVEAAIRASWSVVAPPSPPAAVVNDAQIIPPAIPQRMKGHAMPAPLFQFDQGAGTLDCWVRCIESFFLRYGYSHDVDQIFQAGFGFARPAGGQAAPFSVVKRAIQTLATQDGVQLQLIDLDNPDQVSAALADPDTANAWTIIAGVAEQDLQPGQTFGHYIILERRAGDVVTVVDSLQSEDGNQTDTYTWEQVVAAMAANWDATVDAIGAKIVS